MRKTHLVAALLGLALFLMQSGIAYAMGGNLSTPSISIPGDPQTKQLDPVVKKMADALMAHQKMFTGGSFLNSHSVLYFGGGTDGVNALLADLAKIEGAELRIKFAKEAGVTEWMFPGKDLPTGRPCDCKIDHLGWGAARLVTVTIFLGGSRIDPEALELPVISGHKGDRS